MGSTRSSRWATSLVALSGGRRRRIVELQRARPRYAEALRRVAHLRMMKLQTVALALAISDHQHHHVPLGVDKAARRLLIVNGGFERIPPPAGRSR